MKLARSQAWRAIPLCLVIIVILGGPTVLAQEDGGGTVPAPDSPVQGSHRETWFEVPDGGDTLGPVLGAAAVFVDGSDQDGFLPPLAYSADQLTRAAQNIGPAGTLVAWLRLYCWERADTSQLANLRGRIKAQVWTEDTATDLIKRLLRLNARANGPDVMDADDVAIPKLRKGDRLWWQITRDTVSPLEDLYCYVGCGIRRDFTGDGRPVAEGGPAQ